MISNMYPTESSPNFGVFVKNFERDFPDDTIQIVDKTVIQGKKKGVDLLLSYLRFFWEIVKKLNSENFDLVYVHYLQHSLIPFHFWRNNGNKKIILNAHGTDILGKGKFYQNLRRWNLPIFHRADLVIIPSRFFISKLKALGVQNDKLVVYPSGGIDPKVFFPIERAKKLQYRIGYLGRLDQSKGIETLIDAFSSVDIDDLKLEICGSGDLEKDLVKLCEKLKIRSRVTFLGNTSQKKIRAIFQTWDVLIFPSELEESLGLVGLEAMACGLPVIGSGMGGMSTYLKSGKNGILFKSGDSSDLQKKIVYFYNSNEEFRKFISNKAIATANKYIAPKVNTLLRNRIKDLFLR